MVQKIDRSLPVILSKSLARQCQEFQPCYLTKTSLCSVTTRTSKTLVATSRYPDRWSYRITGMILTSQFSFWINSSASAKTHTVLCSNKDIASNRVVTKTLKIDLQPSNDYLPIFIERKWVNNLENAYSCTFPPINATFQIKKVEWLQWKTDSSAPTTLNLPSPQLPHTFVATARPHKLCCSVSYTVRNVPRKNVKCFRPSEPLSITKGLYAFPSKRGYRQEGQIEKVKIKHSGCYHLKVRGGNGGNYAYPYDRLAEGWSGCRSVCHHLCKGRRDSGLGGW